MTQQMPDKFIFRGHRAAAIAISERFVFSPTRDFGIKTKSWMTSNHRGFWCYYNIEKALIIEKLCLVSEDDNYPPIHGIQAEPVPEYVELFEKHLKQRFKSYAGLPMQYVGLNYMVNNTGSVLIGVGIKETNSLVERYKQVFELQFEGGLLIDATDATEIWLKTFEDSVERTQEFWWLKEENSYYELLNFRMMGFP